MKADFAPEAKTHLARTNKYQQWQLDSQLGYGLTRVVGNAIEQFRYTLNVQGRVVLGFLCG